MTTILSVQEAAQCGQLLRLQVACEGQALEYIRRLAAALKGTSLAHIEQWLAIPDPSTLSDARKLSPALVPLPSGLALLHFPDATALICTQSPTGALVALPLTFRVPTTVRLADSRVPFKWTVIADPDRSDVGRSVICGLRVTSGGLDVATGDAVAAGANFPDDRLGSLRSALARQLFDWVSRYHSARAQTPDAWPAALLERQRALAPDDEGLAQKWTGDVCTYLAEKHHLGGTLGMEITGQPPCQTHATPCSTISLLGNGDLLDDKRREEVIADATRLLDHPCAPWKRKDFFKLIRSCDKALPLSPGKSVTLFGLSDRHSSAHRKISLFSRMSLLEQEISAN